MQIIKHLSLFNLLRYSIFWLLFFLPISVSLIIWDKYSYFSWVFSPWATIGINLSDIFLLFSLLIFFLIIWLHAKIWKGFSINHLINKDQYFYNRDKTINSCFAFLCITLLIAAFFSQDLILHLFLYLKFIWILFLFLYLPENVISKKEIGNVLLFSFLIQWVIVVYQFVFQSSIWLHFLWEPNILKDVAWIAKIDLSSWEKLIRPYGTMQHANILWISCVIVYFLSLYSSFAPLRYLLIIPIVFSLSRTAWLLFWTIFFINILFDNKKVVKKILIFSIVPILLTMPYIILRFNIFDHSFFNRLETYWYSLKMLASKPLWVWFWNFTLHIQSFSNEILEPWKLQPVHNFFLLFANEAWIIALTLFITLFYLIDKHSKQNLFIKLILGSVLIIVWFLDHFFLTSTIWMVLMFSLIRFI